MRNTIIRAVEEFLAKKIEINGEISLTDIEKAFKAFTYNIESNKENNHTINSALDYFQCKYTNFNHYSKTSNFIRAN